ncbi:MAG TPA: hypothetical protein DEF35_09865 [Paenibacillus sp.]|uniref:hypothetical protein n=2 Tax=Paenibacillus TaxID=44249 RepID=UPI000467756A|nr:hypothetical protein [Paenibacillus taichungensis]OZQ72833.1 hypothetical protein CA599_05050 [Paenibacillus taichungensis]HBU81934.1 hypothetical protein [Paenibacillus sp.]
MEVGMVIASCDVKIRSEIHVNARISSMEIIQYDMRKLPFIEREQIFRYCGLFKISCGHVHGFAEFELPEGSHPTDLVQWASVFRALKGMHMSQVMQYIKQHQTLWGHERMLFLHEAVNHLLLNLEQASTSDDRLSQEEIRTFLMQYALTYYSF